MTLTDGRSFSQTVILQDKGYIIDEDDNPGVLARLSMQRLLHENPPDAAEVAVKYQLICPLTNYIVIAPINDQKKKKDLPALRKVPQMMAAGWGGMGTTVGENSPKHYARVRCLDFDDISFCLKTISQTTDEQRQDATPYDFIYNCNRLHRNSLKFRLQLINYDDLLGCNLPDRILEVLIKLSDKFAPQPPEEMVVLVFLIALLQSAVGQNFSRKFQGAVEKALRALHPDDDLIHSVAEVFNNIDENDWGVVCPDSPI